LSDELQLTEIESLILQNAGKTDVPGRYAAASAVAHLRRAWPLRVLDPSMAVFRCITGVEESATAIFHALKLRDYTGAHKLRPYNHTHKAAIVPFLNGVESSLAGMLEQFKPSLILAKKEQRPRASLALQFTAADGKPWTATPEPPLHGVMTRNGQKYDFRDEIAHLTTKAQVDNLLTHLKTIANERNRILYASATGVPEITDLKEEYFTKIRREIFRNIGLYLLITEYEQRQDFVQQCLDAFLGVLGIVVADPTTVEAD
jgi:hypothetical protein